MRRLLAIYPTLLRVGFASALAYRAELLVWMLTTNLPLINLALWSAVAREAPVHGYGTPEFVAYYLSTQVVRLVTSAWVVWEMTTDVRQGVMAMRLLRPVHPLLDYSAENLAAVPLRAMLALPIAVILVVLESAHLSHDPFTWACVPLLIAGGWAMTFLVMSIVGTLAFFVESAGSVFELWLGLYAVFSGYMVPLAFFPHWLRVVADVLPFRLLLGVQVQAMLGQLSHADIARAFALQALWIAGLFVAVRLLWNAGVRRYAAYGG